MCSVFPFFPPISPLFISPLVCFSFSPNRSNSYNRIHANKRRGSNRISWLYTRGEEGPCQKVRFGWWKPFQFLLPARHVMCCVCMQCYGWRVIMRWVWRMVWNTVYPTDQMIFARRISKHTGQGLFLSASACRLWRWLDGIKTADSLQAHNVINTWASVGIPPTNNRLVTIAKEHAQAGPACDRWQIHYDQNTLSLEGAWAGTFFFISHRIAPTKCHNARWEDP